VLPADLGVTAARPRIVEDAVRLGEPSDDYPVLAQPERLGRLAFIEQDRLGVQGIGRGRVGRGAGLAGAGIFYQERTAVEVARLERGIGLDLHLRRPHQRPPAFAGSLPDNLLELAAEGPLCLAEPL